jgi:uncharacterized membrane protein
MKRSSWRLVLIAIVLALAMLLLYSAMVQSNLTITSTHLRVYRDGLVHVEQKLLVDQTSPQETLTMLSNNASNLVVLDSNQSAVDYQITNDHLVIYSLGATELTVDYDVNTLTSKQSEVWTLLLDNPYSVDVSFPTNSSIIYLSNTPTAIDTANNELSLGSGQWEISYILQLVSPEETTPPIDSQSWVVPIEYLIGLTVVLVVACAAFLFVVKKKRKPSIKKALNGNPTLMNDDKAVLEFLAEKDGKAFEAEIRQRFPDMPRTSLWRLIKRLEKLEIVEVKKIGLENQVILKK